MVDLDFVVSMKKYNRKSFMCLMTDDVNAETLCRMGLFRNELSLNPHALGICHYLKFLYGICFMAMNI